MDEENIVATVDFDCGTFLCPQGPTKVKHSNGKKKQRSTSRENPEFIPNNDQHTCFLGKEQAFSFFVDPYKFWDMDPAATLTRNQTTVGDFVAIENPQLSTHQIKPDFHPVFSSLGTRDGNP